jgi:hypothetical protein
MGVTRTLLRLFDALGIPEGNADEICKTHAVILGGSGLLRMGDSCVAALLLTHILVTSADSLLQDKTLRTAPCQFVNVGRHFFDRALKRIDLLSVWFQKVMSLYFFHKGCPV